MTKYELRKDYLKAKNIQHVYLNGKKCTLFDVYLLNNGTWSFCHKASISGHFKTQKKLLNSL